MSHDKQLNQPHFNTSLGIFKNDNFKKNTKPLIDNLIKAARIARNPTDMDVNDRINQRLKIERKRAIQALQNSQQNSSSNNNNIKPSHIPEKENFEKFPKSNNKSASNSNIAEFNRTEYVPYRRHDSINISDLVTDKTIHLASITPERISNGVIFEPIEITGRSTQYNGHNDNIHNSYGGSLEVARIQKSKNMSVNDILASSFAPKARDLCETLKSVNNTINNLGESRSILDDCNDSQNLLHTADMSLLRHYSNDGDVNDYIRFNAVNNSQRIDDSANNSEDFVPGELMNSKLLSDEISWAKEYATIPTKVLSNQAKQKIQQAKTLNDDSFSLTAVSHSTLLCEDDISVGSFFNKRSDDISNIIETKTAVPTKFIEEKVSGDNTGKAVLDSTIKINATTHTHTSVNDTLIQLKENDKSYAESLSALGRALNQLDLENDICKENKKGQIEFPAISSNHQPTTSLAASINDILNVPKDLLLNKTISFNANILRDILLENKENINPNTCKSKSIDNENGNSNAESQLTGDNIKIAQINALQARLPLSPISINSTTMDELTNSGANENKESPLNDRDQEQNIKKNSIQKSAKSSNLAIDQYGNQGAINGTTSAFSSTRLEIKKVGAPDSGIRISPNVSRTCETPMVDNNSQCPSSSTNNIPMLNVPTIVIREDSPTSFAEDISPITSPNLTNHESPNVRKESSPNSVASSGCTCKNSGTVTSSTSRCSNASEFRFRDGKPLPFKVTTTELSWISTKLRTDSRKSFQIKNTSNKRVALLLQIDGPGFQLVNNQRSTNALTLYSQECRTITVNFCPTIQGAAVGCVAFYAPNSKHQAMSLSSALLKIPLYGYGGHARVHLTGILKGPIGSPYLPMGQLCDLRHGPLEHHITIYNYGPLHAFSVINIDSVGLFIQRLVEAFDIYPQKVIIPPGGTVKVHIVFHPERADIKKIAKKVIDVFTVANLRVVHGDEVSRQRIKRLMNKMTQAQRSYISSPIFHNLWTMFPDEMPFVDIQDINECSDVATDLLTNIHVQEIAVTIDHRDTDESHLDTSSFLSETDETILFRTICMPITNDTQISEEKQQQHNLDNTKKNVINIGKWLIEPILLNINLRNNDKACVYIFSNFNSSKHFVVSCNSKNNIVQFQPNEGYIPPGHNQTTVHIIFKSCLQEELTENILITITVENESVNVPVNIHF